MLQRVVVEADTITTFRRHYDVYKDSTRLEFGKIWAVWTSRWSIMVSMDKLGRRACFHVDDSMRRQSRQCNSEQHRYGMERLC